MTDNAVHIVTGGAGFIGRALVKRLLTAGARVVALDNLRRGSLHNIAEFDGHPRFAFLNTDISEREAATEGFWQR